jgi:hypothetical protein
MDIEHLLRVSVFCDRLSTRPLLLDEILPFPYASSFGLAYSALLLFLVFLALLAIPLLQSTHASLAGLGISHKEGIQIIRLHDCAQHNLVEILSVCTFPRRTLVVGGPDQDRQWRLWMCIPQRVVCDFFGTWWRRCRVKRQALLCEVNGAMALFTVEFEQVPELSEEL